MKERIRSVSMPLKRVRMGSQQRFPAYFGGDSRFKGNGYVTTEIGYSGARSAYPDGNRLLDFSPCFNGD